MGPPRTRKRKSSASEPRPGPERGHGRAGQHWHGSAPRRDHHGWKRPLGGAARPAARRGTPRGRGGGSAHNAGRGRSRRRGADALCLLVGELAAEQRRNLRSHRPDALELESRILGGGAEPLESAERLAVAFDANVPSFRTETGEVFTPEETVYYILSPFLHLNNVGVRTAARRSKA